jgi:hypothetical protein
MLAMIVSASDAVGQPVPSPGGDATAWGKPTKGLQAGLRCPKGQQMVRPGEGSELEVVVRNVGDEPIAFAYLPPSRYLGTAEKGTVTVSPIHVGQGLTTTVLIHPGKELVLGRFALGHIRPAGKYQVGAENVTLPTGRGKDEWVLPTGYLDIELIGNK